VNHETRPAAASAAAERAALEAERLHHLGYNCAESVLGGVVAAHSQEPAPLRIATGFGGGIGRTGDVCGAVTGAVLALGWLRGRTRPDEKEIYARVSASIRGLLADFRTEYGTLTCSALTGYDLSDPAVLPRFADDQERRKKCAAFIDTAARLAADAVTTLAE